jgi:site-specific recombinase XerD
MPAGETLLDLRDRAILKFYLCTGARIATGCRLKVSDFHQDGDEATIRFHLKGSRMKTKGIHFAAADAIAEYLRAAGIDSGPLFRPRSAPHSEGLSDHAMTERTMNRLLMRYLERLPRRNARARAARWIKGPALYLLAAFAPRHGRHAAARQRRAHRGRAGSAGS